MKHCKEVTNYITSLYSKLTAYVKTKNWTTEMFRIKKGVFQGDTLPALVFLVAFNPIISNLFIHYQRMMIPTGAPGVNLYVYVLKDKVGSQGLAKVILINRDGTVDLLYRKFKGRLTEVVKLD